MSDFRLNRVLSKPLTAILLGTPLTPNHITTLSMSLGVGAGLLFSQGRYGTGVVAAFLYQLAVVLDNCDGEVARAKNMKSRFGGWYDILADLVTDICLFGGVALGVLKNHSEGPVAFFTVMALSGALIHVSLVVFEKIRGFGPAAFGAPHPEHEKRKNPLLSFFDALREGDSSWFVPLFAVSGKMIWLLWFGGVYMQFLWVTALAVNFRWLVPNKET